MQIKIDKDKCLSCGMCASLCAEIFKLEEDGKAKVIKSDCCGTCCNCDLKEIAGSCPGGAIEVK